MDNLIKGKHFSITDAPNVKTVIYQIAKTDNETLKLDPNAPKNTVERLKFLEEFIGENTKKTFMVENLHPDANKLLILSFAKEKVVVNVGQVHRR
jgi:hypothetical protein